MGDGGQWDSVKYMVHLLIKISEKEGCMYKEGRGRLHLLHYWKTGENKTCSFYPFKHYLRLLMWDWFLLSRQHKGIAEKKTYAITIDKW